jgi:hypothetical protein
MRADYEIDRPKYSRQLARQLPQMFKNGKSVADVCTKLNIARNTFYSGWANKHQLTDITEQNDDVVSRRSRIEWWALVAEIAGGLAVVISVIYLAVQINDNTRMLRSQSHYNALDVLHSPGEIVLENADLASLMVRCNSEPDSVSVDEWERCRWFYFLQMNGWEYTYYQNLERTIPEQLWFGVDGVMRQYVAHRKSESSHPKI